ncbi:MAG TPA: hypothetical protein VGO52_19375 [Hyphomonadaceae bacterium]|jgi:hypothetical protein|nr:hypothetical protein [Hyphomonadaceae bacterium]
MASWFDPLRESVHAGKSLGELHQQAREMIASGIDREAIFSALEEFRAELREADNEPAEDLVMEVMDFFAGWCHPDARL